MKTNSENGENQLALIELQIVHGATSGLISFDERTGSVEFAPDVSFEQWREVLRLVKGMHKRSKVAMADIISFGNKKWGPKRVNECLEQLELEAVLVKAAIAISTIPKDLRLENLEPDHFVELAKANLPRKQVIRWARIASEQGLTASQLRFSIAEGEVVDRSVARQLGSGVYTVHGIRQSFDIWLRRVDGLDGIKKMDLENQMEILDELSPIVELGIALHEHLEATNAAPAPDPARA